MDPAKDPAAPELIAVDGRPPAAPSPARVDAAQRVMALYKRSWSLHSEKEVEEEILKGMQCTICFEPWTSSGPHQTTVLKCGHLFGRSCLLQCLQARRTCPLCNEKASASHLRPVFAQHVIALDAEVRDKYSQMAEEEKQRRLQLESELRLSQIQCRRLQERTDRLFNENQELRRKSSVAPAEAPPAQPAPPPMVKAPAALFPAFDGPNKARKPLLPADLGQLRFKVAEQIKIVQGRAFAFAGDAVVCTSKAAVGAAKWGIWRLSLEDLRQRRFIPTTHDQMVRDIRVSAQNVALTAAMDKRLTLTALDSGAAVHSLLMPVPVWSCEWSRGDAHTFYCGLANGSVLALDTRYLAAPVTVLCPAGGPAVHSLLCHPSGSHLIAASAGEVRHIDLTAPEKTVARVRFPLVQGFSCSAVSHDGASDAYLASFRSPDASRHLLFRLSQELATTDQVVWNGLSAATTLTRTRVFSLPTGRAPALFAATGDEVSQTVVLWSSVGSVQQQNLPPHPSPVLDVLFTLRGQRALLASLSDSLLQLYVPDV